MLPGFQFLSESHPFLERDCFTNNFNCPLRCLVGAPMNCATSPPVAFVVVRGFGGLHPPAICDPEPPSYPNIRNKADAKRITCFAGHIRPGHFGSIELRLWLYGYCCAGRRGGRGRWPGGHPFAGPGCIAVIGQAISWTSRRVGGVTGRDVGGGRGSESPGRATCSPSGRCASLRTADRSGKHAAPGCSDRLWQCARPKGRPARAWEVPAR